MNLMNLISAIVKGVVAKTKIHLNNKLNDKLDTTTFNSVVGADNTSGLRKDVSDLKSGVSLSSTDTDTIGYKVTDHGTRIGTLETKVGAAASGSESASGLFATVADHGSRLDTIEQYVDVTQLANLNDTQLDSVSEIVSTLNDASTGLINIVTKADTGLVDIVTKANTGLVARTSALETSVGTLETSVSLFVLSNVYVPDYSSLIVEGGNITTSTKLSALTDAQLLIVIQEIAEHSAVYAEV